MANSGERNSNDSSFFFTLFDIDGNTASEKNEKVEVVEDVLAIKSLSH